MQPDAFIDAERETLVALCGALVEARSVNPPGDVRAAASVVRDFLAGRGIEAEVLAAREEKPNLVMHVSGAGPGRHLSLNGHLDTIPPGDETAWSVPVFRMERREGRLTGLGIGNMKAGLAALALATVWLHQMRDAWSGTVSFSAVADETVFGPDGAGWLLEARPDLLGDALISAEGPGDMALAVAEKGLLWLEIVAAASPGQGMTSTRESGAPVRLAQALIALDALNDWQASAPADVVLLAAAAGEHGLRVSVNCGRIEGGAFVSQVATRVAAEVDIRVPPGLTIADIEARVGSIVGGIPGLSWRRIKGWDPSWTASQADIVATMQDAIAAVRAAPAAAVVRLPASDAARWRARGAPAVCFGPQPTLAAGIDDFVYEQDVVDCAKIYARAAVDYLARPPQEP